MFKFTKFPKIKLKERIEKEKNLKLNQQENLIFKKAKEGILLRTLYLLEQENLKDLNKSLAYKALRIKYSNIYRIAPEIENLENVFDSHEQIISNSILFAYKNITDKDPKDKINDLISYNTTEYDTLKNKIYILSKDYNNRLKNLLIKLLERSEKDKENSLLEIELEKEIQKETEKPE